jgi:hypothetical protein
MSPRGATNGMEAKRAGRQWKDSREHGSVTRCRFASPNPPPRVFQPRLAVHLLSAKGLNINCYFRGVSWAARGMKCLSMVAKRTSGLPCLDSCDRSGSFGVAMGLVIALNLADNATETIPLRQVRQGARTALQ